MTRQLALLLTTTALLATSAAHADEKLVPMKVGIMKMAALTDPWVAQQRGIFAKNGLDVTLVEFNTGSDAVAAGQGGSVDVVLAIPGTAMTAIERGFDLVAIFQNEIAQSQSPDTGSVQVLADSPIHTLADLAGKKVAVSSLHSQNTVALQMLLKKAGVSIDSITWLEIPFPTQADLLRAHQADAIATVDPYTTQLLTTGVGRVISWNYVEAIPEQPLGVWFTKSTTLKKNPQMIEKFDASIKEAIDYMNADPTRARGEVTGFTGLSPDLVKNMPMIGWDYHVKVARWQAVVDMMHENGELTSAHKAEDFMSSAMKPYIVP
jgi:NitT/TauT family transport system substrate-binding protein